MVPKFEYNMAQNVFTYLHFPLEIILYTTSRIWRPISFKNSAMVILPFVSFKQTHFNLAWYCSAVFFTRRVDGCPRLILSISVRTPSWSLIMEFITWYRPGFLCPTMWPNEWFQDSHTLLVRSCSSSSRMTWYDLVQQFQGWVTSGYPVYRHFWLHTLIT